MHITTTLVPRLIGQVLPVHIDDATAFTLFGNIETGEQVGVEHEREMEACCSPIAEETVPRISLPLV